VDQVIEKMIFFWRSHFSEDYEKAKAAQEVQKEVRRIVRENWNPIGICVPPDEYDTYADRIVCIIFKSPVVNESKICECLRHAICDDMGDDELSPEQETQTERVTKILGFFWWRLLDKDSERAKAVHEVQQEVRNVIFNHWHSTGINLPEKEYDRYASRVIGIMYNPPLYIEREIRYCLRSILEIDIGHYLHPGLCLDEARWNQLMNQLWHPKTLIAKELISLWWNHFGEHDEKAKAVRKVQAEVRRVFFEHWSSTGTDLSEDVYDTYTDIVVSVMFSSPDLVEKEIHDCIGHYLLESIMSMHDDKGEFFCMKPEDCEELHLQSPLIAKKLVFFWRSHFGKE
jgi:hypothetical protein